MYEAHNYTHVQSFQATKIEAFFVITKYLNIYGPAPTSATDL